jgi:hypothetical protein
MNRHVIELADGTRHIIEYGPQEQTPAPVRDMKDSFVAGANQGATMNFGDEMFGAFQGMYDAAMGKGNLDQTYADRRDQYRQADSNMQKANPNTYLAGNVAGGLATAPVLPMARPAATMLGNMGRGAATGAAYAGVAGFGAGEDGVSQRLQNAGEWAPFGAAVGGVLPPVIAGAARAGSAAIDAVAGTQLSRALPGRSTEQAADRIIAKKMRSGGQTAQSIQDDFNAGDYASRLHSNSQANLPEVLADTSNGMQRLAGSVYRAGGEGAEIIKDTLTRRQRGPENPYAPAVKGQPRGQSEDIIDAFDRALTVDSKGTALANDRSIVRQQKLDGDRLYKQARDNSEAFDLTPAVQYLRTAAQDYPPAFAARLNRAAKLFERGTNNQMVDDVLRFDNSKKALDDMIETAQRGGQNQLARELTIFKNQALDAVHATDAAGNPTRNLVYKEARDTWGTAAERREAIDMGRNALKADSELTAENYQALSKYQQMLFRIGMKQGVRQALATKRPGNDVTQLFQQRRVQELMAQVIPRSPKKGAAFADRPQRFGEYMNRQQRMVETNRKAIGGSETAERLSDDGQFAADAVGQTANMLRGGTNAILEVMAAGASKVFGMRQDVAAAVAKRLVESDPSTRAAMLQQIEQRYGRDALDQFMSQIYAGTNRATAVISSRGQQQEDRR